MRKWQPLSQGLGPIRVKLSSFEFITVLSTCTLVCRYVHHLRSSPLLSCWFVVLLHFVLPAAIFSQEWDVHDNYFLKLNFRLLTSWASEMELISQTFAEWLLNRKMCLLLRHLMNWCAMSPELLQRSYHVSCINLFHFFFLLLLFFFVDVVSLFVCLFFFSSSLYHIDALLAELEYI